LMENLIALLLDLINPSLVWDNEAAASKNNINPYISIGINIVLIAVFAAPFIFWVVPALEAGSLDVLNTFAIGSAVLMAVVCAGFYIYIVKTARRHLMEAL
ncbi:MAG: hypothetical protein HUJ54_14500, partial [Erysipelotrichaceae bacterium]|nr:hypothetical protein [Erysipelotrichaceae bacterium]